MKIEAHRRLAGEREEGHSRGDTLNIQIHAYMKCPSVTQCHVQDCEQIQIVALKIIDRFICGIPYKQNVS